MATRPADVARSLVFYPLFYGATALFVAASLIAGLFSDRTMRRVIDQWSAFHRTCTRLVLGIQVEQRGAPPPSNALIVVKHESFFEAIDLPNLLENPAVFAKAELLRIPLWGRTGRNYGLVPVERDQGARALRAMVSAARGFIAAGRVLALFPEGTRVAHGTRLPLQSGFVGLYKLLDLPVIPVAVDSGPLYHRRWKRPGKITYVFGEPIPPGLPRAEIEARVLAAINALNPESSR